MSTPRELTFVSPRFLFPTDSGGKIRTTQILRGMKGGAFRLTLVMPCTDEDRSRYADQIDSICDHLLPWEGDRKDGYLHAARRIGWLFHEYPVSIAADRSERGRDAVTRALDANPDVVVFDFPHAAVLGPDRPGSPTVMFTHNIEAQILKRHWQVAASPVYRWLWRNQYRKMLRYERKVLQSFDTVIAVSEQDGEFFRSEYGVERCRVIPTGVDTDFFDCRPPESDSQVVFCGSMDWMANVDGIEYFFDRVWPLIRQRVPRARMKVVGRTPPAGLVQRICSAAPEWEFTGFVDDVREHVGGSAAFVIPLRIGGGTRIKAFEAMAMGVPVVSTSIGMEGLAVEDGRHFLCADTPEEMASSIIRLLEACDLRREISGAARQLVVEKYGYRRVAEIFERICLDSMVSVAVSDERNGAFAVIR